MLYPFQEILKLENLPFQDILEEFFTNMTFTKNGNDSLVSVLQTTNELLKNLLTNSSTILEKVNSIIEEVRDYLEVRVMFCLQMAHSVSTLEKFGAKLVQYLTVIKVLV